MITRVIMTQFQSTLPMRGATVTAEQGNGQMIISIHAPHAGSDIRAGKFEVPALQHFNPRSPCGERRLCLWQSTSPLNFNPRSPCGERPSCHLQAAEAVNFNPRSPCGERRIKMVQAAALAISIHAPHAGSDQDLVPARLASQFQSTLPMRGATRPMVWLA